MLDYGDVNQILMNINSFLSGLLIIKYIVGDLVDVEILLKKMIIGSELY